MSTRAAAIWFLLALLSAALAVLTVRRDRVTGPGAGDMARLSDADLSAFTRIDVRDGRGATITIRRAGATELWLLEREGYPSWPVDAGRVRSMGRVITMVGGERVSESIDATSSTVVTFRSADATLLELVLSETRLQGKAVARAIDSSGERTLRIDDGIHRSMSIASLLSWRDRTAFPSLPSDLSRMQMMLPDGPIELARVSGRWGLRQPVSTLAEQRTIDTLIRTLQLMEPTRFLDTSDAPFPDNPRIRVTAEVDRRDPAGDTRTIDRWTMELGGTGPQGGTFLARLSAESVETRTNNITSRWGPVIAEIRADRLSDIPAAVEPYIARSLLYVPDTDVGGVTLRLGMEEDAPAVTYTRDRSGWSVRVPDSDTDARAIEADQVAIRALVGLATRAEPEKVTLLPSSDALSGGMPVQFTDLGGRPLQNARIFIESTGQTPLLILKNDRVVRTYRIMPELAAWFTSR